jgi:hypothetical protein
MVGALNIIVPSDVVVLVSPIADNIVAQNGKRDIFDVQAIE